jgi:hypothetical protein
VRLVIAMREIQPRDVHAGRRHALQRVGRVAGGPDRADDFRVSKRASFGARGFHGEASLPGFDACSYMLTGCGGAARARRRYGVRSLPGRRLHCTSRGTMLGRVATALMAVSCALPVACAPPGHTASDIGYSEPGAALDHEQGARPAPSGSAPAPANSAIAPPPPTSAAGDGRVEVADPFPPETRSL